MCRIKETETRGIATRMKQHQIFKNDAPLLVGIVYEVYPSFNGHLRRGKKWGSAPKALKIQATSAADCAQWHFSNRCHRFTRIRVVAGSA